MDLRRGGFVAAACLRSRGTERVAQDRGEMADVVIAQLRGIGTAFTCVGSSESGLVAGGS